MIDVEKERSEMDETNMVYVHTTLGLSKDGNKYKGWYALRRK